jgi:hypothetical protein
MNRSKSSQVNSTIADSTVKSGKESERLLSNLQRDPPSKRNHYVIMKLRKPTRQVEKNNRKKSGRKENYKKTKKERPQRKRGKCNCRNFRRYGGKQLKKR